MDGSHWLGQISMDIRFIWGLALVHFLHDRSDSDHRHIRSVGPHSLMMVQAHHAFPCIGLVFWNKITLKICTVHKETAQETFKLVLNSTLR